MAIFNEEYLESLIESSNKNINILASADKMNDRISDKEMSDKNDEVKTLPKDSIEDYKEFAKKHKNEKKKFLSKRTNDELKQDQKDALDNTDVSDDNANEINKEFYKNNFGKQISDLDGKDKKLLGMGHRTNAKETLGLANAEAKKRGLPITIPNNNSGNDKKLKEAYSVIHNYLNCL